MTICIPKVVDAATTDLMGTASPLSPHFATFFSAVHSLHSLWRWSRRYQQIQSHPENFNKLLAGYVIGVAAGDNALIRIAARLAMIANRLLQCAKQKLRFYYACVDWIRECRAETLVHPTHAFQDLSLNGKGILSPGQHFIWLCRFSSFHLRVRRIFRATILLLVEAFKLSMQYVDVVQAFSLTPEAHADSVHEFFLNYSQFFRDLEENQETLVANLRRQRKAIQAVLDHMQVRMRAEDLAEKVDSLLRGTNTVYQTVGPIANAYLEEFKFWGRWVWASINGVHPDNYEDPQVVLSQIQKKRMEYRYAHNPAVNATRNREPRQLSGRFFTTLV